MNVPPDLKYTKTHEWIRVEDDGYVVGITDFAQQQLSDLTYVDLPTAGDDVAAEHEVAVVESVKAASDIYAPVNGVISEVNSALENEPELINADAFGNGWIFKMTPLDPSSADSLLTAEQYQELLPDEG